MMATALHVSLAISLLAAVVAVAGVLVALFGHQLPLKVRYGLATSVVAVLPGLAFLVHAVVYPRLRSGGAPPPYDLWTILPALLWILVGPFVLLRSYTLAPPRRVPPYVDMMRLCLVLGWMAMSYIAAFLALLV
jgi:hypothetical protein